MSYTYKHRDISLISEYPAHAKQVFHEHLNYENLQINDSHYKDYKPTRLQFIISSEKELQWIDVEIPYANRLTKTHIKYLMVCRYDDLSQEWFEVPHQINQEKKLITFSLDQAGVYGIFINHYWYSDITQQLADEYPRWTKARQSKDSTAQLFLNFFGMELEQVKDYLNWIQDQKYIHTADIYTYDWIYRYPLSDILPQDRLEAFHQVNSKLQNIPILEGLHDFFYNDKNEGVIVDYDDKKVYTAYDYGEMVFRINRNGKIIEKRILPEDHHIWNAFDEFGLLLGLNRKHLEDNQSFKERILDVFRYPSGTHDIGLTNGIARDLGLIVRKDKKGEPLIWKDDHKALIIQNSKNKFIDIRTIRIDGLPVDEGQVSQNELGDIRIEPLHTGKEHEVSFIVGVKKHELHQTKDLALYRVMYQADGQATSKLLRWAEYINTVAPVMWGHFNWDEGFWDTIDKELTGVGYIPNTWDSNIDIWQEYQFDSDR